MNTTEKEILLNNLDEVYQQFQASAPDSLVKSEVSSVTEIGNLKAVLDNLKYYLSSQVATVQSSLLAVILSLPAVQQLIIEVCEGVTKEGLKSLSEEYLAQVGEYVIN